MIKVEHLTKCYGDFMAVKDLSFEIEEGHVYGFLGPNGAGKSTTMNIMTGCLSATDGKITIGGHDIFEEPETAKRLIGYLPEQPPLYMNETPEEYLRFVGEAKGLRGAELRRQIDEVIGETGLEQMRGRLISALSKGYKQRVGIAQALLGNPGVIILDEPTVGLDPLQIIEIRDLIRRLGETHTVIFSSHILSEVQAICEQVLIIAKGKLVAFDTPENLETLLTGSNGIYLSAEGNAEEVEAVLRGAAPDAEWSCTDNGDGSTEIHIKADSADARSLCCGLFFAFAEAGIALFRMTTKRASLEDVFIELTEGAESPAEEAASAPGENAESPTEEAAPASRENAENTEEEDEA